MTNTMFEIDGPLVPELREERRTWSALSLLSFALISAAIYRVSWLTLWYMGQRPDVGAFFGIDRLDFWLRTLSTWPKFLAAIGLLSIAPAAGWRPRGLMFLFCTAVDVGLWTIDSSRDLSILDEKNPVVAWLLSQNWLLYGIGTAVGWSEFMLLAGMIGDVGATQGVERSHEIGESIRKLTKVGMVLWMLYYLGATRWVGPNPIAPKRFTIETFLLCQAMRLIWTVCLIRMAALSVVVLNATGKRISQDLKERRKSDNWPYEN